MRLRSRQPSCKTGSKPRSNSKRQRARLLMRITALLPSVTLKACTRPRKLSAASKALEGSAPNGGVISTVTTGWPEASAC